MPLLAAQRLCNRQAPCRRTGERCARCEAAEQLIDEDWYLIGFYHLVADQYINQTPMGGGKDCPPLLTPRLEGYEAALRINGYPREHWAWLCSWASVLHRLHRGLEKPPVSEERKAHMRSLGVEV